MVLSTRWFGECTRNGLGETGVTAMLAAEESRLANSGPIGKLKIACRFACAPLSRQNVADLELSMIDHQPREIGVQQPIRMFDDNVV